MRAVLDESAPRRLARTLRQLGLDVSPFPAEWGGMKNGRLLAAIGASPFDGLVTSDKNMRFQQAVERLAIGLIVLPAQRFEDLRPFLGEIADALRQVGRGEVIVVQADSGSRQRA